MSTLGPDEIRRYNRHILLPEFGLQGQLALKAGRVLIIGVGGLGTPAAQYLAAAGVGTIGLCDDDRVAESNLPRQILYTSDTVGDFKTAVAAARLRAANPYVEVREYTDRLDGPGANALSRAYDVVLDCSDNFATRYALNAACAAARVPLVFASVYRFEGELSVFHYEDGPCYRCLHPEAPPPEAVPNCAEGGVIGVLPGVMGVLQATEAIKILARLGNVATGRVIHFDALSLRWREWELARRPECPDCGSRAVSDRTGHPLGSHSPSVAHPAQSAPDSQPVSATPGLASATTARAETLAPEFQADLTVTELSERLARSEALVLLDVREAGEVAIVHIPGSLHIPLGQLGRRWPELPGPAEIIVYCKSGARSAQAVAQLRAHGLVGARNLRGGILAWIREVDPALPVY